MVDFDSPPSTTTSAMDNLPTVEKRRPQMAPLRTALKPDPVNELDKMALTGIEEVSF